MLFVNIKIYIKCKGHFINYITTYCCNEQMKQSNSHVFYIEYPINNMKNIKNTDTINNIYVILFVKCGKLKCRPSIVTAKI